MSCSSHIPYKQWRLQILSDLFLPHFQAQSRRPFGRRYSSSSKTLRHVRSYTTNRDNNDNQFNSSTQNIENETLRRARPSDSLPKSPLFKLSQTRATGHRPRKPQGTKADDARLRDNPWAIALASPLRYCTATSIRVPKAFLTEMSLVRRIDESPEGSQQKSSMWLMPTGLVKDKISNTAPATPGKLPDKKPPVMRLLTRALMMELLPITIRKETGKKVKAFSMVPSEWRMRFKKSEFAEVSKVEWPEGLTDLILKYLGGNVVTSLKEAYRYEQMKSEKADQWRVLQVSDLSVPSLTEGLRHVEMKDMGTGAVVIVGDLESETTRDPFASQFPDYLTLPQTQSTMPVIDLSTLLSASDRKVLRESIPRFAEKALFFRADGPKSVDAMLAMWELKGFIMHDTDYVPDVRNRNAVDEGQNESLSSI